VSKKTGIQSGAIKASDISRPAKTGAGSTVSGMEAGEGEEARISEKIAEDSRTKSHDSGGRQQIDNTNKTRGHGVEALN